MSKLKMPIVDIWVKYQICTLKTNDLFLMCKIEGQKVVEPLQAWSIEESLLF